MVSNGHHWTEEQIARALDKGAYLPTQEEIRACTEAIQKTWSRADRERRRILGPTPFEVPTVNAAPPRRSRIKDGG